MHTYLHMCLSQICVKSSCFFVMHVHLRKCVHHNKQLHSLPHVYVEHHHVHMELGTYSGYKPETMRVFSSCTDFDHLITICNIASLS